ncbi:nicotianamine aminotransferase 1-like [Apium graveolens]|uniref:Aminotransferase class I/classII large domain-containing protein n=1 Tax=Apium graveolens TaxID=4045 RepID=A0A6L5BBP0_APIGR|nr:hypothetical protein AG4045_030414 [Apium graveolens]
MKSGITKWCIRGNKDLDAASKFTVRGVLASIMENLKNDGRPTIPLGHGDPSSFPCFKTTPVAEDSLVDAIRSAKFNCYGPAAGISMARRSVADHLSLNLPYKLSPDDIFLTVGANHAIEVILSVLARPGANILIPRPGYPVYEARAAFSNIEVRHFNLLPENGWEVDLRSVEALADGNTVAIVIINPGNPCGNVFTHEHLKQVAETAKRLGILVIADEVYNHLCFGSKPFVPGGVFGPVTPVLTLGSLSKRWIVPGWRLGWIAINDPNDIMQKYGLVESIKSYISISAEPPTFIQGALPQILEKTTNGFFSNTIDILKEAVDVFHTKLEEIPCLSCPQKPEGAMSCMVKLNLSLLEGIHDDMDFCIKLAKEESVIVLPGAAVGLKNWLRITFAVDPAALEEGLERIKAFYLRHAKKQGELDADQIVSM